jgi:DNA-binding NtrC family response regulator
LLFRTPEVYQMTTSGATRLMVVDEAEDSRAAIARYFAARGWEVAVAARAVDALAQGLAHAVDVVIMNATLPGLEGYEAAAILRKISPGVSVILTVGPDADAHPRESQRRETFRCFPKPLDLDAIARAVEDARAGHPVDSAGDGEDAG